MSTVFCNVRVEMVGTFVGSARLTMAAQLDSCSTALVGENQWYAFHRLDGKLAGWLEQTYQGLPSRHVQPEVIHEFVTNLWLFS